MNFYDLSTNMDESLRKNETTTMSAISYLPSQVGVVKATLAGLKKHKSKWNIEILEGDKMRTVCFEDQLQIHVPHEHWASFNSMFDGQLDENSYLDLSYPLLDSDQDEDVFESRKERLRDAIVEHFQMPILQALNTIATRWIQCFDLKENLTASDPTVLLGNMENAVNSLLEDLIENEEEDLGKLDILESQILDNEINEKVLPGKCLAGCRYLSQMGDVDMIFEAQIDYDLQHQLSIQVDDPFVVDQVEESVVGLKRIQNIFYPTLGQTQATIEALIETITELCDEENTNE